MEAFRDARQRSRPLVSFIFLMEIGTLSILIWLLFEVKNTQSDVDFTKKDQGHYENLPESGSQFAPF